MEIDSVEKSISYFEGIINMDRNVEAEDFLNLAFLQDKMGLYSEAIKNRRNILGSRQES